MDSFSHQVLTRLHTLPIEIRKKIFSLYVRSDSCCTGIEVKRGPPNAEQVDYLVPNTFLSWDSYVDGQREFRHGSPVGYFLRPIQWARDKIQNGDIKIGRDVLYIDAHSLIRYGSRETILAKKALMINLQIGACPLVIFRIWHKMGFLATFSCTPYQQFYKHFGKILATNPLGIEVVYDQYDRPRCVWDYARVSTPEFCNNPLFFVNNLTERQAHVNWENKISPPDDILRGLLWYEEEDDGGRFPLDKINKETGYNSHF